MNSSADLDRLLVAFLDEGPRAAPDRPLDLAVQYALAHPRGRDPLRVLRPDVMPRRRPVLAGRPAAVLVVVGLLIAVAAVAVVGGLVDRPSVVLPAPTPTVAPTVPPTLQPARGFIFDAVGNEKTVTVEDESGLLAVADGVVPDETVDPGTGISVENESPATLRLTWIGCPDDPDYRLTIDAELTSFLLERDPCSGDTLPVHHALRLTFDGPVAADDIDAELRERRRE